MPLHNWKLLLVSLILQQELTKAQKKIADAAGAYLITYMTGNSHFLQSQCAWAAGNITNECEDCFSVLKAQGLLPALESLIKSPYPEVIESVIFALTACSKYQSSEMSELIQRNVDESLLSILNRNDISIHTKSEVLFILSNISLRILEFSSESKILNLIKVLLEQLETALGNGNIDVLLCTPILRCLGNLASGPIEFSNFILCSTAFQDCLTPVLTSYGHLTSDMFRVLHNILVNTDTLEHSDTWCKVMKHIGPCISPLNNNILQVLYFLCTLKSKWSYYETELNNYGLSSSLSILYGCGDEGIEMAMRALYAIPTSNS